MTSKSLRGRPRRPLFRSAALTFIGAVAITAGCATRPKAKAVLWVPIPDAGVDTGSNVRGNALAAGLIANSDQVEIVSHLLNDFFHPENRDVRWLDPRPLSYIRSAADDTVKIDPDFADEVIALVGNRRYCVLDWRDAECRGKAGVVIRVSWPYKVGHDSAVIYAASTPRDSTGALRAPTTEMQFRLKWRPDDNYWAIIGKTKVYETPDSTTKKPRTP